MNTLSHESSPVYGGWRRTKNLDLLKTTLWIAGVSFGIAMFSSRVFLFLLPFIALASIGFLVRFSGESLALKFLRRLRFWWGTRSGYVTLDIDQASKRLGHTCLPSVLASTRLLIGIDERGHEFGLIQNQQNGHLTVTLKCDSRSTWLVDGRQADVWVLNFHSWLADLGRMALIAWVAVTVETAPEPGATLSELVDRRVDNTAPEDVLRLMRELVKQSPSLTFDVKTRVSITFNPSKAANRLKSLADQVAEVNRLLVGMESALNECGVSVLGRASAAELAGIVRAVYDPVARGDVNRVLAGDPQRAAELLVWDDSGPRKAKDKWNQYSHDSGVSVTYAWLEAPRQQIRSDVLIALMGPSIFAKRVTMLYKPLPAELQARVLEDQKRTGHVLAGFKHKQGFDATARDRIDLERAHAAADEEAAGAGVVDMSLYVTVTVTNPDDLETACAEVESRGQRSKVQLRRMVGSQPSGFATTLPAGIYPPEVAKKGRR